MQPKASFVVKLIILQNGVEKGAESFHTHLPLLNMRLTFATYSTREG